jgi:hypothetical protein
LRRERQPGDLVVCWGTLPQGLIFHTFPAINATNRPYLAGISPQSVPFEFPGNRDRFGTLILEDVTALANLLARSNRVLLINREMDPRLAAMWVQNLHLRTVTQVGDWHLYSSR